VSAKRHHNSKPQPRRHCANCSLIHTPVGNLTDAIAI
jgi:hypothetical protein